MGRPRRCARPCDKIVLFRGDVEKTSRRQEGADGRAIIATLSCIGWILASLDTGRRLWLDCKCCMLQAQRYLRLSKPSYISVCTDAPNLIRLWLSPNSWWSIDEATRSGTPGAAHNGHILARIAVRLSRPLANVNHLLSGYFRCFRLSRCPCASVSLRHGFPVVAMSAGAT
jgi:hypothetical protein